jgi:hypothetical protein
MLTRESFKKNGYKQYPVPMSPAALFLLQKTIEDEAGVKYYISVDVFPAYPHEDPYTYHFQPMVQYRAGNNKHSMPVVNMTYLVESNTFVYDIEDFFEKAWKFMGEPYYERNEDA